MKCTYCNTEGEEIVRDHVISAASQGHRNYKKHGNWIVPACHTCNGLLSDVPLTTIPERCGYLLDMYENKFKKILKLPDWTDEEIDSMGDKFKLFIIDSIKTKAILKHRMSILYMNSLEK
jgi:hypothetical protein